MDNFAMSDALKIFKGKRVFFTGHTGFKGSWFAFLLHELGADVRGFALNPIGAINHFNLLGLSEKVESVIADIRDAKALEIAIKEFQPEFVFHLAAQALVRQSYDDPITTFSTNLMGSVNLLEAVRNCDSIRSLVYITSDKCYENVEWVWGYRETDQLGGRDPYSASKAAAELAYSCYERSFYKHRTNLGAASARAGNVIGGGDWASDRIIPDCIRAIEANEPVKLRNPNATRPWQHVLEPISGYLLLSAKLYEDPERWRGAWNFGPSTNDVRTVSSVAREIISYIGKGSLEHEEISTNMYEANLLQLNCDKAYHFLNWSPRWNVDETIKYTAFWYRAWMNGESMEKVTRSQINEFFSNF